MRQLSLTQLNHLRSLCSEYERIDRELSDMCSAWDHYDRTGENAFDAALSDPGLQFELSSHLENISKAIIALAGEMVTANEVEAYYGEEDRHD